MKLQTDYAQKWLQMGNAAANASERMRNTGLENAGKRLADTASYCFMRYEQSTSRLLNNDRDLVISYIGAGVFTLVLIAVIYSLFLL